jgi:hypothetical protein
MHLYHLDTSLKIPSRYKEDFCILNHSQIANYTSSLLWNQ